MATNIIRAQIDRYREAVSENENMATQMIHQPQLVAEMTQGDGNTFESLRQSGRSPAHRDLTPSEAKPAPLSEEHDAQVEKATKTATKAMGFMGKDAAQDFARAQAQRGKWKPPSSCSEMFKGKDSVFSPSSPHIKRWDLLMALLLVYTAIVTPFEVAYLEVSIDFLFILNRVVDLLFMLDMVVNFLAPFQGKGKEEGQWIFSSKRIAVNYLQSWFVIDLLSVLPFDLVGVVTESEAIKSLKAVRIIRLFRLLKLLRVLRSKRIFARWETMLDFNYKLVSLVKFATIMLVFSHWVACIWMLAANVTADCVNLGCAGADPALRDPTWVDSAGLAGASSFDLYAAGIYWSVMTLSTIGYGDIAPANTSETVVAVLCMLGGASLWAYVVGNVCGVVASLDVRTLAFRQTMDDLNFFMAEKRLPQDLRRRLREYFHQARHMHQTGNYEGLLRKLSPKLRGEVSLATNRDWVAKVSYFRFIRDDCLSAIAVNLRASVYAPQELITANELHIVMRGVAGQTGRIITRGNIWGEDMILEDRTLARTKPVRALTYLDVYALSRQQLFAVLEDYPVIKKKIQRIALLMALVRKAGVLKRERARAQSMDTADTTLSEDGDSKSEVKEDATAETAEAMDQVMMKDVMRANQDVGRVEARLQRNVEVVVAEQVRLLEDHFKKLTVQMETRLRQAILSGGH